MENGVAAHRGGAFEDFLEAEGMHEEVYGEAIKRVLAWQLDEARRAQSLSKTVMAERLGTSRAQLDRILDPSNLNVSIETLDRAARALGKRLKLELLDAE